MAQKVPSLQEITPQEMPMEVCAEHEKFQNTSLKLGMSGREISSMASAGSALKASFQQSKEFLANTHAPKQLKMPAAKLAENSGHMN